MNLRSWVHSSLFIHCFFLFQTFFSNTAFADKFVVSCKKLLLLQHKRSWEVGSIGGPSTLSQLALCCKLKCCLFLPGDICRHRPQHISGIPVAGLVPNVALAQASEDLSAWTLIASYALWTKSLFQHLDLTLPGLGRAVVCTVANVPP